MHAPSAPCWCIVWWKTRDTWIQGWDAGKVRASQTPSMPLRKIYFLFSFSFFFILYLLKLETEAGIAIAGKLCGCSPIIQVAGTWKVGPANHSHPLHLTPPINPLALIAVSRLHLPDLHPTLRVSVAFEVSTHFHRKSLLCRPLLTAL